MLDIYVAAAMIAVLSAALAYLGVRIGGAWRKTALDFTALATVGAIVVYINFVQESVLLTRLLPFSNLIVLGNWFPLLGSFLAGMAWKRVPGALWRRCLSVIVLGGVCLYSGCARFLGNVPVTSNVWRQGICRQTSESSCSAASAATLLKLHGIDASETEMASLCFTRAGRGTTWYGLYRGLKIKTAGTPWDVEAFNCDLSELSTKIAAGPAILSMRLDPHPGIDPRYERKWGWTPGMQHAAIMLRFAPGNRIDIDDPSTGRESWGLSNLNELWHGEGMRLVKK